MPVFQAGFRPGRGTRDNPANLRGAWKAVESEAWNSGAGSYDRTDKTNKKQSKHHLFTDWFKISKGGCQGCI